MTMECSYCGEEFCDHKTYVSHLPCGRMTIASDVTIFTNTLYGGPHRRKPSPEELPFTGNRSAALVYDWCGI